MCGISGLIINNSSKGYLYKNLIHMQKQINHRGPDYSGAWVDSKLGIGLAHNRLSILDLSPTGNQPMKSKSGRYIISFNGEIYNYLEIKKKLNKQFPFELSWNGTSDTEVLITAIDLIGLNKTLRLIKGMFAFALWDNYEQNLYLVRDRFGEKPLYWGFIKNMSNERILVFASELNAIKKLPFFNNKFSNEGINKYFSYGYISAPTSIYNDIYQIVPGKFIKINYSEFKENNYYSPEEITWYSFVKKNLSKKEFNYKEVSNNVEDLITNSLSLQNNADVPICSFLSGGIDSSLVAALLQKISPYKINTFTIAFPEDDPSNKLFNEGPYASEIAKYLGTNHTEIEISSKDALDLVPKISEIYTEPFSDSSQIPTYLICKAAKDSGYKVALTGDGADELFGGYNRHLFLPKIFSLLKNKPIKLKKIISLFIKNIPLIIFILSS